MAVNAQKALDDNDTTAGLALALAVVQSGTHPARLSASSWTQPTRPAPVGGSRPAHSSPAWRDREPPWISALMVVPCGRSGRRQHRGWPDIASREEILRLRGHTARVNDIVFSHDGARALSGGADGQVIVWDLAAGREVRRFSGHSGVVRAVGPADGRIVASGGFAGKDMLAPGELILWDVATGAERRLDGYRRHRGGGLLQNWLLHSWPAQVMPKSSLPRCLKGRARDLGLVGVTSDMLLWDVATGEVRQRFEEWAEDAFSIAITPDGTRALAGSFYSSVATLWICETAPSWAYCRAIARAFTRAAFTPDGLHACEWVPRR